jgi:hypothetical protein
MVPFGWHPAMNIFVEADSFINNHASDRHPKRSEFFGPTFPLDLIIMRLLIPTI